MLAMCSRSTGNGVEGGGWFSVVWGDIPPSAEKGSMAAVELIKDVELSKK